MTDRQRAQILNDAEADLAAEKYEDARLKFGRVLASQPANSHARMGLAEVALGTGNIDQANAAFHALVDESDDRPRALQGEGLTLVLMRQTAAAVPLLEEAVRIKPSLWRAWNALGEIYDSKRDWKRSAECYQNALKGNPHSEIVHNNIGMSKLMQGRYAEAEQEFSAALKVRGDFKQAENNRRIALAWEGKYAEAKADVNRQDLPNVLNNIGYVAMMRGDYERAEAFLTQAMDASPTYFERAAENLQHLHSLKTGAENPENAAHQ